MSLGFFGSLRFQIGHKAFEGMRHRHFDGGEERLNEVDAQADDLRAERGRLLGIENAAGLRGRADCHGYPVFIASLLQSADFARDFIPDGRQQLVADNTLPASLRCPTW
jgi:hypothetical protein